jgi:CheY-like chemotaxis protein
MNSPKLDDEAVKSLNHINDGVERTARLIKQMLAFSRKQVMQRRPLDMKETLAHTADMLNRLLGENVVLKFEIAPALPAIMADAEMFQQIILNLVVNARDAMSSGGELTIRANEAIFGMDDLSAKSNRKAGRFVRLSVADTGSGMDTAIINHLFEPFFTTKDVGKGSGLGLASVDGIVNQHQGWIEVESKLGKGTCFDIYFPIAAAATQDKGFNGARPSHDRGGEKTILMIEDHVALRLLVRDVLHEHGYDVLEAADGLQALQLWDSSPSKVDLLLMSLSAPKADSGHELTARLWQINPHLPVIFVSDENHETNGLPEKSGRFVTCLPKPYQPAQLIQAVRDAFDAVPSDLAP